MEKHSLEQQTRSWDGSSQVHPWCVIFASRHWHTFSSCVSCCSPSGNISLTYFYPSHSRPHQILRLSHQHPLDLAKTAVHGTWRCKVDRWPIFNSLSHHTSRKHTPGHHTPALQALSGCAECYWRCSALVPTSLLFSCFVHFCPSAPFLLSFVIHCNY